MRIIEWDEENPFSIILDDFDFPWAIAERGKAVLHLNGGTVVNGENVDRIIGILNKHVKAA